MMEVDLFKAAQQAQQSQSNKSYYFSSDDVSEVDTALNTPTSSLSDTFIRRSSTTSSSTTCSSSFNSFHKLPTINRKPSMTPKSSSSDSIVLLEKKLQQMELELNEHMKREMDLESQLIQQRKNSEDTKSTLSKMNQHIDRFLTHFQPQREDKTVENPYSIEPYSVDSYAWLEGNEIPVLLGYPHSLDVLNETNESNACLSPHKVFIYRLKYILDHRRADEDVHNEINHTLDSWLDHENNHDAEMLQRQQKEHERVTRLLEALNKSLTRNKMLRRDSNLIMKHHQQDLKRIVKEKDTLMNLMIQQQKSLQPRQEKPLKALDADIVHDQCERKLKDLKVTMDKQIQQLEQKLLDCQEERDEYETTVEMVRREMETMLEELEDTRQQKLRFKTQASRLRAGLEAIQKRERRRSQNAILARKQSGASSSDEEEEDEATESLRLMYNEAERQAMDLDRECKRQALTLSSIRNELKSTEEKYQAIKMEKNKQINQLDQINRELARKVELLGAEKQSLSSLLTESQQKQLSQLQTKPNGMSSIADENEEEKQFMYQAKIYALQIALKVAKSDASIQRTKIYQLERQTSLFDFTQNIIRLQDMFQKERETIAVLYSSKQSNEHICKRMAESIEIQQRRWKLECQAILKKRYDVDLLQVNRDLRILSGRIVDLEEDIAVLESRHQQELTRVKYMLKQDEEKRVYQLIASQKNKEQEFNRQVDTLHQQNQTLQDELLVLCGRNVMMANKLGSID